MHHKPFGWWALPGPARVAFSAPSRSLSLTKEMGILRKEGGEGKGVGKMEWGMEDVKIDVKI